MKTLFVPAALCSKIYIFVIDPLTGLRYAQAAHTGGSLVIFENLPAAAKANGDWQLSKP